MCNCNQQRIQYNAYENQNPKGMVKVKLITKNSLLVNGDLTGRSYIFRKINDINWVDKRDAMGFAKIKDLQLIS